MVSVHLWRTSEALPSPACSRLLTRPPPTRAGQAEIVNTFPSVSAQYACPRDLLITMNQPHRPMLLLPGYAHSSHPPRAVASHRWPLCSSFIPGHNAVFADARPLFCAQQLGHPYSQRPLWTPPQLSQHLIP
ncbi:hypothetical protein H8959_006901 [Pygathrix nigripes]